MSQPFKEEMPNGHNEQPPTSLCSRFDKIMFLASLELEPRANLELKDGSKKYGRAEDSGCDKISGISPQYPNSPLKVSFMQKIPAQAAWENSGNLHATNQNQNTLGVSYSNLLNPSFLKFQGVIASAKNLEYHIVQNQRPQPGNHSTSMESSRAFEIPPKQHDFVSNYTNLGNYIKAPGGKDFGEAAFHGFVVLGSPSKPSPLWRSKSVANNQQANGSHARGNSVVSSTSGSVTSTTMSTASAAKSMASAPKSPPTGVSRYKDIRKLRSWRSTSKSDDSRNFETIILPDDASLQEAAEKIAATVPAHVQVIAAAIQEEREALAQRFGPGTMQSFRPSYSALQKFGLLPNLDVVRSHISSAQFGGSEKYLGDMNLAHNRSANISDNENCSLWIKGLPAKISYTTLLQSIRNVGKVYATVINPPSGVHTTSAAKVVLFDRLSAEKLFNMIASGEFRVMGQPVMDVRWNKIKSETFPNPEQSRTIRITGPERFMDFNYFDVFFNTRFTYEVDRRVVIPCFVDGTAIHEWHFSSLRCQSASAKTAIEREHPGIFSVQWARDPCAHP